MKRLGAVALLLLGLTACGGSSADDLARQACREHVISPAGTTGADLSRYESSRADAAKAASTSARAAREDGRWNALASAYSRELDFFDEARAALFTPAADRTPDQLALLQRLGPEADSVESVIRAECRKANS